MERTRYLTAREAADELGITMDSLYVYVSRGMLRSEAAAGQKRRRYHLEEVERLKRRREEYRHPDRVATGTMQAGAPVMESAITLIASDRFYYRGHDALTLATTHSIEQVASLIWTGEFAKDHVLFSGIALDHALARYRAIRSHLGRLTPLEAFAVCLPLAGLDDIAAYDLRPDSVAQTGARILHLLAAVAAGRAEISGGIARTLQWGWAPGDEKATALLSAALVLCADQELNVTSFAARCVASAGSTPYAVVSAGLSALQGIKHAGQSEWIETFLRATASPEAVRSSITSLLKRGEPIPGFGEVVPGLGSVFYPNGDPRGELLLRLTAETYPDNPTVLLAQRIAEEAGCLLGDHPTVFFGLVTLAHTLRLPPGGAIALFALGRTIGWIGHSIEQYQTNQVIRPRATYIGPPPKV